MRDGPGGMDDFGSGFGQSGGFGNDKNKDKVGRMNDAFASDRFSDPPSAYQSLGSRKKEGMTALYAKPSGTQAPVQAIGGSTAADAAKAPAAGGERATYSFGRWAEEVSSGDHSSGSTDAAPVASRQQQGSSQSSREMPSNKSTFLHSWVSECGPSAFVLQHV